MPKRFALICCGLFAVVALAGCQNSGQDSDDYSFDSVGEQQVYDLPRKALPGQNSARPAAFIPEKHANVATKQFDNIGEQNVFDE